MPLKNYSYQKNFFKKINFLIFYKFFLLVKLKFKMNKYLLIAIGGSLGALSRYFVSYFCAKFIHTFPLGTLTVNVAGSFLITFIANLFLYTQIDPIYTFLLITGFLGAFTTFSSFTYETLNLFKEKLYLLGFLNIFLNFFLAFLGGILGIIVSNFFFNK